MLLSVQQNTLMNVQIDMENGKNTFGNENRNILGLHYQLYDIKEELDCSWLTYKYTQK